VHNDKFTAASSSACYQHLISNDATDWVGVTYGTSSGAALALKTISIHFLRRFVCILDLDKRS